MQCEVLHLSWWGEQQCPKPHKIGEPTLTSQTAVHDNKIYDSYCGISINGIIVPVRNFYKFYGIWSSPRFVTLASKLTLKPYQIISVYTNQDLRTVGRQEVQNCQVLSSTSSKKGTQCWLLPSTVSFSQQCRLRYCRNLVDKWDSCLETTVARSCETTYYSTSSSRTLLVVSS